MVKGASGHSARSTAQHARSFLWLATSVIKADGLDDFIVTDMLSRIAHPAHAANQVPDSPIPAYTRERAWDRPQIHRQLSVFFNRV